MKGIVYQIYIDSHPDIHYVGSTIHLLENRWQRHKNDFKNKTKRRPIICQYFDKFGIDNFQIRVIKEYEVIDLKHLIAYEQLWINKLKPINLVKNLFRIQHLIKKRNQIYKKTYYENNREQIKENSKIYYENNREQINELASRLYTCYCSPDKQITSGHRSRHEKSIKHQKYLQRLEEKQL